MQLYGQYEISYLCLHVHSSSISFSVCPQIFYLTACLSIHPFISPPVYPFTLLWNSRLSILLCQCLSYHQFFYHQFFYTPVCPLIVLSYCLSVCPSNLLSHYRPCHLSSHIYICIINKLHSCCPTNHLSLCLLACLPACLPI